MHLPQLDTVSPKLASVLRISAAIGAAVLLAGAIGAEAVLATLRWPVPGVVLTVWLAYAIWSIGLRPPRLMRAWGWRLDDNDFHVAGGVLFRTHTIVPLARIQHIDVAQGPIERAYGVATLIVHTAGFESTAVALPGLLTDQAGEMRDAIRTRMMVPPE